MISAPKTALVTGGSQRVGRSLCLGLANAGYGVAVHYNASKEQAAAVVKEITDFGGKACSVAADLSDSRQTRQLINTANEQLGPIGLLINNASVFNEDALDDIDDAVWDQHFNVHVKAPAILSGAFQKQGLEGGLIVNIIDERVWKLTPNFTSYTLSKSALWTATKTFAQALAPHTRVNAIGPGPTLPSSRQTQVDFDTQVDTLLLKTAPDLSEFVNTILLMVGNKSMTGQMIALDGGQHLGWQTPDQLVPE